MNVLCSVCEAAEAKLLCCADEAVLCWGCDDKIHAANILARKHQRVPLSATPSLKCDICQDAPGYFFCAEDRALLCRNCDVSIHTMNYLVSSHQRFLFTGVKVGLEAAKPAGTSTSSMDKSHTGALKDTQPITPSAARTNSRKSLSGTKACDHPLPHSVPRSFIPISVSDRSSKVSEARVAPVPKNVSAQLPIIKINPTGIGGSLQCRTVQFFGINTFSQNHNYMTPTSAKAFGNLAIPDADEFLSPVPESTWMVPEFPFTSNNRSDREAFVPEMPSASPLNADLFPLSVGSWPL